MKPAYLCRNIALWLALPLACAGTSAAQAPGTGAVKGTVYDPTGLAIQNAQVTVVNDATNAMRTATTTTAGVFSVSLLSPGRYTITIEAPGFAKRTAKSIPVVVSETNAVEFRLQVANVAESVSVEPNLALAQTESASLGRAVDQQTINALPLSNRNYTQILSLSPGVVVELPNASALGRGTQDVTANGSKTTSNNIQFNGIDANNLSQNSAASDGEDRA